ncbi:MAG: hypothetical protein ACP5J9_05470 [Dictyoglomus sp.]
MRSNYPKLLISLLILIVLLGNTFSAPKYNEAPVLAQLVKEGKLPPIEERLPKNPVVLKPYEEIGKYGGLGGGLGLEPEIDGGLQEYLLLHVIF